MNDLGQERPYSWAADMSGSLVTFPEADKVSWGILLKFKNPLASFQIPSNIKEVDFLIMDPQRTLTKELRNIDAIDSFRSQDLLTALASSTVSCKSVEKFSYWFNAPRPADFKRKDVISDALGDVIDRKKNAEFMKILRESKSDKLLIVHGHGGGKDLTVGEQYWMEAKRDADKQRMGNAVTPKEILEKFTDYAAIVFHTCNSEKVEIEPLGIPIVYARDVIGGGYKKVLGIMNTTISMPKAEV